MAVPAQIAVLLALTAGLFDAVPLPRMAEAQRTVQAAAAKLDAPLLERLVGTDKLSDEERKTVTDSARAVLKAFLPTSSSQPGEGCDMSAPGRSQALIPERAARREIP